MASESKKNDSKWKSMSTRDMPLIGSEDRKKFKAYSKARISAEPIESLREPSERPLPPP